MNRVKGAVFSLTPLPPADDDGSYLTWHLMDHMPEQYQLPGIVHAQRWVADGAYLDSRLVASPQLESLGNVMNYLFSDPVQQTLDDFMELGVRLREIGRFPEFRPGLQLSQLALLRWYAAPRVLISPEVVPFRPHRGVLLLVEEPAEAAGPAEIASWSQWLHSEHVPGLLAQPGVAGVWQYGSTGTWNLHAAMKRLPEYITVVYLDADPLETTQAVAEIVRTRWDSGVVRPAFAGPLRVMTSWEAWPQLD